MSFDPRDASEHLLWASLMDEGWHVYTETNLGRATRGPLSATFRLQNGSTELVLAGSHVGHKLVTFDFDVFRSTLDESRIETVLRKVWTYAAEEEEVHSSGDFKLNGPRIIDAMEGILAEIPSGAPLRRNSSELDEFLAHFSDILGGLKRLKRWPRDNSILSIEADIVSVTKKHRNENMSSEALLSELDGPRKVLAQYLAWQPPESVDAFVNRAIEKKHQKLREAEELLNTVRQSAANLAVHKNAQHFSKLAEDQMWISRAWLVATAILATTAAAMAFDLQFDRNMFENDGGTSLSHWIFVIRSTFLISLPTTAALWCARSYRVTNHNRLVNEHRANAISTFELFLDHGDEKTRSAVLEQATAAVFSQPPTGFGPKGQQAPGPLIGLANDLVKRSPGA